MTYLLFFSAAAVTLLALSGRAMGDPASIALLSSTAGLVAVHAPSWRPPTRLAILLGVTALGIAQLALGQTADVNATIRQAATWPALVCLFGAAGSVFASVNQRQRFLELLVIAAGLIAAFVIVQPYAGPLEFLPGTASLDERVGPFPSRNAYASFVLLAFPVAAWAARRLGPQWWLAAGLLLASAFVTGSRAGAGLAFSEAALLAIWMRNRIWVFVIGGVALAGAFWGGDTLRVRLGYQDPLEHRRDIYASSLELIRERPFSGWGLGSFETIYPAQARFDVGATVNHAHNDWIEATVEGGLAFGAAVTGCAFLMLWPARRTIWALGLPMVLLHSLVDFPFQRPSVSVWFVLLAAAAAAQPEARRGPRQHAAGFA